MKKFNVKVNGKNYEVEVDEILDGNTSTPAPTQTAAPTATQAPAPAVSANATKVTAPMPGNIFKINVTPNQQVKKGDVLIILEAMKMENEIVCPQDGVVSSIDVQKDSAVNTGDLLVTIS